MASLRLIFRLTLFLSLSQILADPDVRNDFQIRGGATKVCGTCRGPDPWVPSGRVDLIADRLWFVSILPGVAPEIGPYGKLSYFSKTPMVAAGLNIALDLDFVEPVVNLGLGYADKRVYDTIYKLRLYPGQTRHTYDIGFELRFPLIDQWRLSCAYTHNSNGADIGINYGKRGSNPGIDSLMFGVIWRGD